MTSGFSPSSHYELYEPIGPITGCDCGTASKHQPRHTRTMDCYVITCSHIHWIEDASSPTGKLSEDPMRKERFTLAYMRSTKPRHNT